MLLSGVVRNRKVATQTTNRTRSLSFEGNESSTQPKTTFSCCWDIICSNSILQNMSLRVHKFVFQWDLFTHLFILICSIIPFFFTGERKYSIFPIIVWGAYNILFATRHAGRVLPAFGRFKLTFQASIEEFFSPKVLPIFSVSFLLVVLSLSATGHSLGGAPLCFKSCGECLASWSVSIKNEHPEDPHAGCGYANGEELLAVYTMAQTSFLSFFSVVLLMAVCMAWKVDQEEMEERKTAVDWLRSEDVLAYHLREGIIRKYGSPASLVRPEGNASWVFFGSIAALSFILLGWHNWLKLPASYTYSLLILLNLLIILLSTMILHVGFFGRLIALYRRNYERVANLTSLGEELNEQKLDSWWNCRNFVLNEDLALDYDIGGLAVSATFIISLSVFLVLGYQVSLVGIDAMLEPPASYCAYASLYFTCCLIRIFTLATTTFEEQMRHIVVLQKKSMIVVKKGTSSASLALPSDWKEHMMENDMILNSTNNSGNNGNNGVGLGQNRVNLQNSNNSNTNDDYDVFTYDENDDFFQDSSNTIPGTIIDSIPQRGNQTPTALDLPMTISNSTIRLVQQSISRIKSSASSAGLFTVNEDKSNSLETKGLLSETPRSNRRGNLTQSASQIAIAAAHADIQSKSSTSSSSSTTPPSFNSNNNSNINNNHNMNQSGQSSSIGDSHLLSIQTDQSMDQLENQIKESNISDQKNSLMMSPSISSTIGSPRRGNSFRKQPLPQIQRIMSSSLQAVTPSNNPNYSQTDSGLAGPPSLSRAVSARATVEASRQALMEMISQIREYDPYPCILGIPVMPALFMTCKFYIFISFMLLGTRMMITIFKTF